MSLSTFFFFNRLFFGAVLDLQKNSAEVAKFPSTSLCCQALFLVTSCLSVVGLLHLINQYCYIVINRSIVYITARSWGCTFYGANVQWQILTIIVSNRIASWPPPPALCLFIPPSSKPLATSDLLTVSMVLPFPERHRAGIILCSLFRLASVTFW